MYAFKNILLKKNLKSFPIKHKSMAKKCGHHCWPFSIRTEYLWFAAGIDDILCGLESCDVFAQPVLFPVGASFDVCMSASHIQQQMDLI